MVPPGAFASDPKSCASRVGIDTASGPARPRMVTVVQLANVGRTGPCLRNRRRPLVGRAIHGRGARA